MIQSNRIEYASNASMPLYTTPYLTICALGTVHWYTAQDEQMCDYSQQTYQATSLTCGAGGAQLMFLGAQLHHTLSGNTTV